MQYELIIYIQDAETFEELEAMRGDEQALIAYMSNWDYGEDVDDVYDNSTAFCDEVVAENESYTITRNLVTGGTYALFRKKN